MQVCGDALFRLIRPVHLTLPSRSQQSLLKLTVSLPSRSLKLTMTVPWCFCQMPENGEGAASAGRAAHGMKNGEEEPSAEAQETTEGEEEGLPSLEEATDSDSEEDEESEGESDEEGETDNGSAGGSAAHQPESVGEESHAVPIDDWEDTPYESEDEEGVEDDLGEGAGMESSDGAGSSAGVLEGGAE
jgi:hypothetical protein